jgi:hypothetical protein
MIRINAKSAIAHRINAGVLPGRQQISAKQISHSRGDG